MKERREINEKIKREREKESTKGSEKEMEVIEGHGDGDGMASKKHEEIIHGNCQMSFMGVVNPSGRVSVAQTGVPQSEVTPAAALSGLDGESNLKAPQAFAGVLVPNDRVGVAHPVVPSEAEGLNVAGQASPQMPPARQRGPLRLAGETSWPKPRGWMSSLSEFLASKQD